MPMTDSVVSLVGYFSDSNDDMLLCRYGKRKAWHLVGTFCVLLAFPFIFNSCIYCEHSSLDAQMVYYGAFVVLFQFGWAAVQISHLALIPELTPHEHHRTRLTSLRCIIILTQRYKDLKLQDYDIYKCTYKYNRRSLTAQTYRFVIWPDKWAWQNVDRIGMWCAVWHTPL